MRLFSRAALPMFLLLAACGSGAEQPAGNSAETAEGPAAEQPAEPVPPLAGQWTITSIDGKPLDQVWPMNVSANEVQFTIESDCRRFAYDYVQDRNIVKFTPKPTQDCGRVASPAEVLIEQPIELANIVMFSNAGKEAQLSGPGGVVTMVRR